MALPTLAVDTINRRHSAVRGLGIVVATLIISQACMESSASDATVPLPSTGRPLDDANGVREAIIEGRLAGDPTRQGGCVWLEVEGRRQAVRWPEGFAARFDPLEVIDPTGKVVAREGALVHAAGGIETASEIDRCANPGDTVAVIDGSLRFEE